MNVHDSRRCAALIVFLGLALVVSAAPRGKGPGRPGAKQAGKKQAAAKTAQSAKGEAAAEAEHGAPEERDMLD